MTVKLTEQEKEHFKTAFEAIKVVEDKGFQCALIGGAVRDLIKRTRSKSFNIEVNDLDFCVFDNEGNSIGFDQMQNLVDGFNAIGFDIDPAGMKFLHVACKKNSFEVEFGSPRSESYVDSSRKPVCTPGSFLDDQKRRDFTVNAIFAKISFDSNNDLVLDIIAGKQGVTDIINNVLRTVGSNIDKVLSDDPVRVLRAVRFSNKFDLTFNLKKTIFDFPEEEFKKVSSERIFDELTKILVKGNVDLLFESDLIKKIIPEFKEFTGKPFEEMEFKHIVKVIKNADTLEMKLVALFHDLGKATTGVFSVDKDRWQFIGHETVSKDLARKILRNFNVDNKTIDFVTGVIGNHMKVKFINDFRVETLIKNLLTDKFILPAIEFNRFDWNGKPKKWQKKMNSDVQHQKILEKVNMVKSTIDTFLTPDVKKQITKEVCDDPKVKVHERGKEILTRTVKMIKSNLIK